MQIKRTRRWATAAIAVASALALSYSITATASTACADESAQQTLADQMASLQQASQDYSTAMNSKADAEAKMVEAQNTIEKNNAIINEYQGKLSNRVKALYRSGTGSYLDVLLGSESFGDFVNNLNMIDTINSSDADMVATAKTARDEAQAAREEYSQQAKVAAESATTAGYAKESARTTADTIKTTFGEVAGEIDPALGEQVEQAATAPAADTTTVSTDQIVGFDESTGTATLADGTQATVVGYDSSTGNAIVDLAMSFVGGSYGWGASDAANSTFDCSGLVQYVYGQNGIEVGGHNDQLIYNDGSVVTDPQIGDICWWEGHVAIYAGNGMMVSADNEEYGITYREVDDDVTYVRY